MCLSVLTCVTFPYYLSMLGCGESFVCVCVCVCALLLIVASRLSSSRECTADHC